jgi:hypothetical protein
MYHFENGHSALFIMLYYFSLIYYAIFRLTIYGFQRTEFYKLPWKLKQKNIFLLVLIEFKLKSMILICSSIQRKLTDRDSSISSRSKGMEAIKEGRSPRTDYLNESSSSDSDFNLNSSMPHNSDTDICGPHTGNNGEFPCHDGLVTDLLTKLSTYVVNHQLLFYLLLK